MKKIIALVVLAGIMHFPISCNCDDCGCGNDGVRFSMISQLGSEIGNFNGRSFYPASESTDPNIAAIGIYVLETAPYEEITLHLNFNFLNKTLACSPELPRPGQAIKSIEIISDEAIYSGGQEYQAGETITELFLLANKQKMRIEDFIQKQNQDFSEFGYQDDLLVFQLISVPDSAINHKLKFTFSFDDFADLQVETSIFTVM